MAARELVVACRGDRGDARVSPSGERDTGGCTSAPMGDGKEGGGGVGGCSCEPPSAATGGMGLGGCSGEPPRAVGGGAAGARGEARPEEAEHKGESKPASTGSRQGDAGNAAGGGTGGVAGGAAENGVEGFGGGRYEPPRARCERGGDGNASGRKDAAGGAGEGAAGGARGGVREGFGGCSSEPPKGRRGVWLAAWPEAPEGESKGLCVGSADPHCLLEPGEVQEPREKRAATFGLGLLEEASAVDLAVRAFPHFNEAPTTAWREAPALAGGTPPQVQKLTDVVPRAVLQRVMRWTARMEACLRAAERGNWRLAKELRPADECFDGDHMVAGTESWVWDLRPLQSGGAAEPLWPSSEERPPETDLDLLAVREAAEGFADQGIVSEAIQGFSDDAPLGGAAVLSPPHEGALRHYAQAALKMQKDGARGWSTGGWRLPFWPTRANAYSVVEELRGDKKKYRMVIDLSWPKWPGGEGQVLSVNASIDRSEWPTVLMPRPLQIAEAAAILLSSGGRVRLWGFDCEAYYRKVGRQRAEIYRNCVWARGGFIVDPREQFGDASAAVKCVRLSGFIVHHVHNALRQVDAMFPPKEPWVLQWLQGRPTGVPRRSDVSFFGMYVDDGAGGSIDDELWEAESGAPVLGVGPEERGKEGSLRGRHLRRAEMHFDCALRALQGLGHTSEPSKEQPPGESLESLGCVIDLNERRVRLTEHKRARYAQQAEEVAGAPATCQHRRLEEVTHKLLYAATVYPRGRQWLHCLFRALRANYRLRRKGNVPVSRRMRAALRSWAAELRRAGHEGVPLAAATTFPRAGEPGLIVAYSDASGEHGFGAWAWCGGRRIAYTCEVWGPREMGAHINLKELVAMAASTEAFLEVWPEATHVREFTDNTCAEWAAHTGTPDTKRMQDVVARRVAEFFAKGVYTRVARIATKENLWADWLSRAGGEAMFLAQAARWNLEVVRVAPASWWRMELAQPTGDDGDAAAPA